MILFNNLWKESKSSIFRLEKLPGYRIDGDYENFQQFLKTGKISLESERDWFEQIKAARDRSIRIERVRIFESPVSDYIKYELEFWKESRNRGEEFFFIDKVNYDAIVNKISFDPTDFWLFDERKLLYFHYSEDGEWLDEEQIDEEHVINQVIDLGRQLRDKSITYQQFIKNL